MKLCYLSDSFLYSTQANAVHVMKMCDALAACGHDVILSAYLSAEDEAHGHGRPQELEGLYRRYNVAPRFHIDLQAVYPLSGWPMVVGTLSAALALRLEPALVYGRSVYGCALSAAMGLETIFELHQPPAVLGTRQRLLFEAMIAAPTFRHLVVISEALRGMTLSDYPQLEGRVRVCHDASSADTPPSAPEQRVTLRPWRRSGEPALHVGYVGHMYPGRGVAMIAALAGHVPDVAFHLIGGTPHDLERWRQTLPKLDNLIFYGHRPYAEAAQLRQQLDVLLAPYRRRVLHAGMLDQSSFMSPLKIFEYMSSGAAIICADLPVLREVLRHEDNALLVEPDDEGAWLRALERLREDEQLRRELARRAQKDWREHYTWEARARDGSAAAPRAGLAGAAGMTRGRPRQKPRLVIAVTSPAAAVLIRGQVRAMGRRGFEVFVISAPGEQMARLAEAEGATHVPVAMEREIDPVADLRALGTLLLALRKIEPDIVSAGTPKAGLLVMIAAWVLGIPARVFVLRGMRSETLRGSKEVLVTAAERASCAGRHPCAVYQPQPDASGRHPGVLPARQGLGAGGRQQQRHRPRPLLSHRCRPSSSGRPTGGSA